MKYWLLGLLLASPAAFALSGNAVATDNVKAQLVSEVSAIAPGQSFWVALEFNIRDGWHTYWRNPGDSGQATRLAWQLPAGFTAGDIVWTTPHRFEIPPLVNYGYAKQAVHLVNITAPRDLRPGTPVVLSAKASWLVCSDVCIPEEADLQLKLPVNGQPGVSDPADAALFAAARSELPSAQLAATTARIQDGRLVIALGQAWGATLPQIKSLAFYPYDDGGIEYAAPQTLSRSANAVELAIKLGYQPPKPGPIRGVLLATEQSGNDTVTVPMEIAASFSGAGGAQANGGPQSAAAAARAAAGPADKTSASLPVLLLFAILGGLILNLMPCVFPVLSIKAIGLVEQAKKHPAAVRAKGLVFALGVISSMLCLAAVLLALRSGGEQIGWGFQLQSPLFVTLLVYLLLAVGLNLSGVFEVGGGLAGVGDGLTQGDSLSSLIFHGRVDDLGGDALYRALYGLRSRRGAHAAADLRAGHFRGPGVWSRAALPAAVLRALDAPGAAEAGRVDGHSQASVCLPDLCVGGMAAVGAGSADLVLRLGCRIGRRHPHRLRGLGLPKIQVELHGRPRDRARYRDAGGAARPRSAGAFRRGRRGLIGRSAGGAHAADGWQPYDAAEVAKLSAAGQPLLVNFTASWCLTCLVNERNAFTDSAVQAVFRSKGVTLMKGDWTNRDPAITRALASFGRAGVPLYVVYNSKPGASEPVILPQILTAGVVQQAFADTPSRAAAP